MRLACTVEYEGTPYHGFQNQTDLPTVQGHIEQAFRKISVEPHSFNYSGRTDAGVHALSQVFDFETSIQRSKDEWIRGLNSNLPKTIAIKNIQEVADDFHSRFSALERYYSYVIYNSKNKPTFFDNFVYWDNTTLDIDKIHQASQELVGKHDFSSFRSSSCGSKNPVKEVKAIALIENGIPVFGGIYVPVTDVYYFGIKGLLKVCCFTIGSAPRPKKPRSEKME